MLLVSIGRIVQFALLLLTLRFATSILSPAEMGKVSIVTATVAFFALMLLNPVGMFMNRRLHAWDVSGYAVHYFRYFWLYLIGVGIVSVLMILAVIGFGFWKPSLSLSWLVILIGGNLVFGTINQVVIPGLNLLGYRGWFMALTVATTAISLLFAVVLTRYIQPSAEYWMSGLLIGQLFVGFLGKSIFFGKLNRQNTQSTFLPKLTNTQIHSFFAFAWPVAIAVGLGWLQSQGYRYLVADRLGLAQLGLFVAGFGISSGLISGFESIFTTYFQPKFYRSISSENLNEQSHAWLEYAQSILPALMLTSMLIIATAPELTKLLLGENFKASEQFIIWGAFAELARIATGVVGMVAHARMKTKLLLIPSLAGAFISLGSIWYLTSFLGSTGVGLGLAISSMTALVVTVYVSKNELTISMPMWLFIRSTLMGLILIALAKALRLELSLSDSHLLSFIRLGMVGVLFLLFQYVMLRPVFKQHAVSAQ